MGSSRLRKKQALSALLGSDHEPIKSRKQGPRFVPCGVPRGLPYKSQNIPGMKSEMARVSRNPKRASREARSKLPARRVPHWIKLGSGRALGCRKTGTARGFWIAKHRDKASGNRRHESLGAADEAMDADGLEVFNYEQACKLAYAFFEKAARRTAGFEDPDTHGHRRLARPWKRILPIARPKGQIRPRRTGPRWPHTCRNRSPPCLWSGSPASAQGMAARTGGQTGDASRSASTGLPCAAGR